MNRVEAQWAALEGKKITHESFADNEFVYVRQTDKELVDENNHILNAPEFWELRVGKYYHNGWSLYDK